MRVAEFTPLEAARSHLLFDDNVLAVTALILHVVDQQPARVVFHSISDLAAISLPLSSRIALVVLGAREAEIVSFKPSMINDI